MVLPRPNGIVTLLTDFGSADPYVGIMKGALLRAHRRAILVDLCHHVPPQDVETAAFFVEAAIQRFPDGTVHLAVVDPGVGTGRRMLAVFAAGCYWIGPDNGVLGAVIRHDGAEVRAIDAASLGLRPHSRTFHGRDLFGPIAGAVACGQFGFRALGAAVDDPVTLPRDARLRVLFVDGFGNLITNAPAARVTPATRGVRVATRTAPLVGTYGEGARGDLVAVVNSYGTLEVAVVDGSAYDLLGTGRGEPVELVEDTEGESP